MQYPTESIAAHVVTLVRTANRGVLGTDLMSAIRLQFDGFAPADYGSVNLRDFIRRFVPEVEPAGRKGMDYLYAIRTGVGSPPVPDGQPQPQVRSLDVSVWKTFASPNSLFKLYAQRADGKLVVVPPGGGPPEGEWVQIPSMSPEKHILIAKDFTDSLTDPAQKARLQELLSRPQWWDVFYQAIQSEGLAPAWNSIRRKRILAELKEALESAGLRTDLVDSQVVQHRTAPRTLPGRSLASLPRSKPTIKMLAEKVLQNMSVSEVRNLRVRLGDVFDAIEG